MQNLFGFAERKITKLKEQVCQLAQENKSLEEDITQAKQASFKKFYSERDSSADVPKKRGALFGHPGASRKRPETIDEYVAIAEVEDSKITIVPNPGNGMFFVYPNDQISGKIVATIFNSAGNKILSKEYAEIAAAQKLELNCSGQPTGIYYLHLTGENKTIIRKLIIY